MRIRAALTTDLEREFRLEARRAEKAVTGAVRKAGAGLKNELRQQTRQKGLGNRLANAWRGDNYPRTGDSLGAAAVVYTKAPKIMQAFIEGATIKSRSGLFLAIPTANAPKRGLGGKRISPSTFPEQRFGRLRFVYRRSGPSLLVVDNVVASRSKRGGFRRASDRARRTGRGLSTAVMFILVPQVRIRKRVNFGFSSEKWGRRVPKLISIEFKRLDAQS